MKQFKKGQVVYASDDQESYALHHFAGYEHSDTYPYKTSYNYQKAIKGVHSASFRYCLSVEDYHKMINEPKDKDLVWAWDNGSYYARSARFYDARDNCTFHPITGNRRGFRHKNYEVIPREQWPQWAIEAYELLKD